MRSWTEVLHEKSYKVAHDTFFPSRADGTELTMMSKQLIYNASLSRRDALTYRTNTSFQYNDIVDIYNEGFLILFPIKAGQLKCMMTAVCFISLLNR